MILECRITVCYYICSILCITNGNYVRANIKPSVIVQYMGQSHPLVPVGTLGHFVDPSFGIGDILKLVQWQNGAESKIKWSEMEMSLELIAEVVR